MHTAVPIKISDLKLDLKNLRTVPQKNEVEAVVAMIAINADYFWGLMDSMLEGYLPTENIIVLKNDKAENIVKEGNRRIAVLKLINSIIKSTHIVIPSDKTAKIASLSTEWKAENFEVPCLVYEQKEADTVDKIISIAHGKAEKASRNKWTSVARARHNRLMNGASEPALDLLEKFIKRSKEISQSLKETWAGDYPISALQEALPKVAQRLGYNDSKKLSENYPTIKMLSNVDSIIIEVGHEQLDFKRIRDKAKDFTLDFGFPSPPPPPVPPAPTPTPTPTPTPSPVPPPTPKPNPVPPTPPPSPSYAPSDPKAVALLLKDFIISGPNRGKVMELRKELMKLKIPDNPLAFCFLLRSMFEISATIYANENGVSTTRLKDGKQVSLQLLALLTKVKDHLVKKSTDPAIQKQLHGAGTELSKPEGMLSVTSMNQLVHNPIFSVQPGDICIVFGNVFPLLKMMNN